MQRKYKVAHLSTNEIRSRLFLQRSFKIYLVPLSGRKRFTLQRKIGIYSTTMMLAARGVSVPNPDRLNLRKDERSSLKSVVGKVGE